MISSTPGLVSIVIPTFNDRDWICDAVDSALAQSYEKCEVIVVDDGSTDGTEALLRSRYRGRIRYLHQPNRGLGAARNTGLAMASGEYVQFLDADDILLPSKVATHVRALEDDSRYSVVYSDFEFVDGSDITARTPSGFTPRYCSGNVLKNLLEDNFVVVHAALSRRADVQSVHGFDESLHACEDYDLWMRLAAAERLFLFTPEVLVLYRRRTGSMSGRAYTQIAGTIRAIRKVPSYAMLDDHLRRVHRRRVASLRSMMIRSLAVAMPRWIAGFATRMLSGLFPARPV